MATITRRLGGLNNNTVDFEYDYDDGTLYVTAFRCINLTDQAAWGSATDIATGRTYSQTFPATATTTQNIPTGQANRLQLTVTDRGVDGVSVQMGWPAS